MRVLLLATVAALSLSACTPPPVASGSANPAIPNTPVDVVDRAADAVDRADVALDRAEVAWAIIKRGAEMVMPLLSPLRSNAVQALIRTGDATFARARTATDLAQRAAELNRATKVAAKLESLTVDPD